MTGIIYGLEKKNLDLETEIPPERRMLPYSVLAHDVIKNVDVCVIGSGAAGAIIASEIALANKELKVVLVEKGGYYYPEEMNQRETDMMALLWKNAGGTFTDDLNLIIAQGQCLGGSTIINDAVCFKTPKIVRDQWRSMGVKISNEKWEKALDEVWNSIHVTPVDEKYELNENNKLLKDACIKLGYHGEVTNRNCVDCYQCGFCHLGCHYGTKQDTLRTYISKAVHNSNIEIYCNCSVEKISHSKKVVNGDPETQYTVDGIEGNFVDQDGNVRFKMRLNARMVIVSAGAIASPCMLLKNNIAVEKAGKGLSFHPASFVLGEFNKDIYAYKGIPMGYFCDEFAVTSKKKNIHHGGFMIESVFLPIFQFSLVIPSFAEYQGYDLMQRFVRYAMAGVMIRDYKPSKDSPGGEDPSGEICLSPTGNPKISYWLSEEDKENLATGLKTLADMWFKMGAESVITGHKDIVKIKRENKDDTKRLYELVKDHPERLLLASAHPQGGNRMGDDPKTCIVDSHCKVHGFDNLFVCDASVFPTAVGVNPQITVMAVAKMTADYINENWGGKFSKINRKDEALGETCSIKQPMFCSIERLETMFNTKPMNIATWQSVLINKPGDWHFDKNTLVIINNNYWLGFFPRDQNSEFYRLLSYFGKFWKSFEKEENGIVRGKVHPFLQDLDPFSLFHDYEYEAWLMDNHPRYGNVILLEYKNLPAGREVYDLIKITDDNTIIGKAFAGTYPYGQKLLVFSMSRKYGVDFMTEDDHETIFSKHGKVIKTLQDQKGTIGRWVPRLVSDVMPTFELPAIVIRNEHLLNIAEGFIASLPLQDLFKQLVLSEITDSSQLILEMFDFLKWQQELRIINHDFMVFKLSSPITQNPIPWHLVPDPISIEPIDITTNRFRYSLRLTLRREGHGCDLQNGMSIETS